MQGTIVTIPTAVGPMKFDISKPNQLEALKVQWQKAQLSNPNLEPVKQPSGAMEIVKPLAIGAGLLFGLKLLLGR